MKKVKTLCELSDYRTPELTSKENYVGIELEFLSPKSSRFIGNMILSSTIKDYVSLKDDSSVESDKECSCCCDECHDTDPCTSAAVFSHELCILVPQNKLRGMLLRVERLLKAAKARVNITCGMHVHLDMRNRKPEKAYENLFKSQSLLFKMVKANRATSTYCRKNYYPTMQEHMRLGERYFAINTQSLAKHKTIEVRLHHGSVKKSEIEGWVNLLCGIVDADIKKDIKDSKDLVDQVKLTKALVKQIERRVNSRKKIA